MIVGIAVTLIFDLLASKSNQFIFVPKTTRVVNLVKYSRAVYNHVHNVQSCTDGKYEI